MEKILSFLKDEEGAAAVEYGVLIALITAALVAIIATLSGKIQVAFSKVVSALG
jgi:pilus assembly protein Flp/PilA